MKKAWLYGVLVSQYKDPYKPTSIMESRRVFYVAQVMSTLVAPILAYVRFGPQQFSGGFCGKSTNQPTNQPTLR